MKIIFLDFDGVMDTSYYDLVLHKEGKPGNDMYGCIFDPYCIQNLKHIIDETGAHVVVTSSWKYLMSYKDILDMWEYRGLPGFVTDVTPTPQERNNRGDEIDAWLNECDAEVQYVIIDDLSSNNFNEHQLPRFLKVNPFWGLDEATAKRAIELLNSRGKKEKVNKIIAWIIAAIAILCLTLLLSCNRFVTNNSSASDSVYRFSHEPTNAVYHWKRELNPNNYEMDFMKKHHIKRMYVKFFDVSTDNLYDGNGVQPVPIATTIFNGSPKRIADHHIEIVPVVFVTMEALRLGQPLCEKITKRVDDMCRANHIEYHEIQLDCDWTRETKVLFYALCQEVKQQLHKNKKGLSATIRLHQLRDTLPDIDYGVLMLYNTESLSNPKVKNSILSGKVVKEYMRHAKSDKHLDFAYPTYEWSLWFKENKFMGIIPPGKETPVEGSIRHEQSDYNEIMETKHILKRDLKDIEYPSSTIIYHLDSANLSKYSNDEIEKIYSR